MKARSVWNAILQSQIETGTPYMLYKDSCNRKSNQRNLGTIKCSNLCTEIVEYTAPDEVAVCNLASIALNQYVDVSGEKPKYDFEKLKQVGNGNIIHHYRQPNINLYLCLCQVTKVVTRNLNKIIDVNYYPVPEARKSNMRNRPIGIGVQGLADAFILMRFPFERYGIGHCCSYRTRL